MLNGELKDDNKKLVGRLWKQFERRWAAAHRHPEIFKRDNAVWLQSTIKFCSSEEIDSNVVDKGGRPSVPFEESSLRSKRRKTQELRINYSSEELQFSANMRARVEGKLTKQSGFEARPLSKSEALARYVEAKMTRHSYNIFYEPAKSIYPPYKKIQEAKKLCYLPQSSSSVSETECLLDLQMLLDHTARRIVEVSDISGLGQHDLQLFWKWGCDGATGMSEYKQKFLDPTSSDSAIFMTSAVPLKMSACSDGPEIWQNPLPASPKWCRPIRIQYVKENSTVVQQEYERMMVAIENLQPTSLDAQNFHITIKHRMMFTMADVKVLNIITSTPSNKHCYVCGASTAQFHKFRDIQNLTPIDSHLNFGLSPLHCWIRTFEAILHVAYRLSFKKYFKRHHEDEFKATKLRIQQEFFEQLGLHVDKPRPGSANSNDGNTARRFFANPQVSSEITGIKEELITRLRNLLLAISSGKLLDPGKFERYAMKTAEIYVKEYGWYKMPPTLHKVLFHGHQVIAKSQFPIGHLSEEPQEALNKEVYRIRRNNTRKYSRTAANQDLINGLIVGSDPVISHYRYHQMEKKKTENVLPEDVQDLIRT
ncbi:uncharacterized protein LOC129809645 [Phlebotomus papatasi]|uniref:uncharacterized protein LOC129798336 n=1 Tax=Phlebotomus papatasi TaxID=29031 RepID=UPI002483D2AF|nr:uncharacterized protein LOC129798336 [Phlebotomus papatasi]XP_055715594.1 uncharacterized protein LOC129809645 [Phlebotomus papatasi]